MNIRTCTAVLLSLLLVLALAACGGGDQPSSSTAAQTSSAAPQGRTMGDAPDHSPTPAPTEKPTAAPTATPSAAPTEEPTPEPEDPELVDEGEDEPVNGSAPEESTDEPDPEDGAGETVDAGEETGGEETGETGGTDTSADPMQYEGADIETFYGVFGYPNSSEYQTSCYGPGEDGILSYDGFTVYTYRDTDGSETVQAVE